MLPKNPAEALTSVTFEKYGTGERAGENLTRFGAFAWGEVVSLRVGCPRRLGVTAGGGGGQTGGGAANQS